MIIGNPAPEFLRLQQALRINWDRYREWIDRNLERVNLIAELAEGQREPARALVRAQYIFETWGRS